MTDFLQVSGHDGLVRDVSTKAIINTNKSEYEMYLKNREATKQRNLDISRQAEEIKNIKDDVSQIKEMLSQLLKSK
jgi:hypothetical protein